jgi:hypothetical protein
MNTIIGRKLVVDISCAIGNDNEIKKLRFISLLKKLENVTNSHNLDFIVVEVTSCRSDMQVYLRLPFVL